MQNLHELPRVEIERVIEALIDHLDELDGDPDLETYLAGHSPGMDDREGEVDAEWSLGWATNLDQRRLDDGYPADLEEQHDIEGEPWSEVCGQGPKLTSTTKLDDVYRRGPDGRLYLLAPNGDLYAGEAVR